jgi:hypothetical protein
LTRTCQWLRPSTEQDGAGELPGAGMEAASGCRCRQARAGPTCPPQRVRCNGAARGCRGRLATDSDHQSGRAGVPV